MKAESKIIPAIPAHTVFQVELTEKEAKTMLIVCGAVGGDASTSRRGDVDAFYHALHHALKEAGILFTSYEHRYEKNGTITFEAYNG